jgi:hypothetical protein
MCVAICGGVRAAEGSVTDGTCVFGFAVVCDMCGCVRATERSVTEGCVCWWGVAVGCTD